MKIHCCVAFFAVTSTLLVSQSFAAKKPEQEKVKVQARAPSALTDSVIEGDLVSRDFREAVFKKAEINEYIQALDELDRDILAMDIWKKSITELEKKYVKIPVAKLEAAQKVMKEALK